MLRWSNVPCVHTRSSLSFDLLLFAGCDLHRLPTILCRVLTNRLFVTLLDVSFSRMERDNYHCFVSPTFQTLPSTLLVQEGARTPGPCRYVRPKFNPARKPTRVRRPTKTKDSSKTDGAARTRLEKTQRSAESVITALDARSARIVQKFNPISWRIAGVFQASHLRP